MVVTGTVEWATGVTTMTTATHCDVVKVYSKAGNLLCHVQSVGKTALCYVYGQNVAVRFTGHGRLNFGTQSVDVACGGRLGLVVTCSVTSGFWTTSEQWPL